MPVLFKKDSADFNQRKLMSESVFDLLTKVLGYFIFDDILSQVDIKALRKNTACGASMHTTQNE